LVLTANDPAVVDALLAYAGETTSPEGLILAAWLLEAKGKLTAEQLKRMIRHNHPRVREHAALILEVSQPNASQFATLAADPDARVRFQTALALGACDEDAVVPLLAKIAAQDTADRWTRIAIAASAGDRTGALLQELFNTPEFVGRPTTDRRQFVQELCELIGSSREAQAAAAVLDMIADHNFRWQQAAITGLAEGFARRGTAFQSLVKQLPQPQRANHLLAAVTQPAVDPAVDDAERTAAVRLLAHAPWDAAGLILTRLIEDSDASLSLRLAAIRSLAAHPRPEVAQQLLKNWRSYTPAVRTEVLEALLRRPDRASALLDAVEAGTVRPGDIDPARIRRLLAVKEPTVAARAAKLLRESLPADRKEVLARYREALTQPGDAQRGREVFQKNCAACHAVAGIGVQVGPDISDTRTKTPEMLLTDILNPNAAIDGNYVSYTVTTKDGRTFVGIIVSESASGITLKREQDQTETILRDEIEDIRSSGLSLMPDGVEKTITVSEMADLIRFLKDWRYLDGATPLGK
jgi:putative heme-binding domain-containing protein